MSASVWTIIVGGALVTYGLRLSFILLYGRLSVPLWATRALRLVPAAVLAALVAPALFYHNRVLHLSLDNERLWAGLLAALIAWRTRNVLLTICSGMAALWLLQWLL